MKGTGLHFPEGDAWEDAMRTHAYCHPLSGSECCPGNNSCLPHTLALDLSAQNYINHNTWLGYTLVIDLCTTCFFNLLNVFVIDL